MRILVLAIAACGSTTPAPKPAPAIDLVLTGGKVFTADSRRPWAEAVAIAGDRIAAVGTSAEIRTLPGISDRTRTIDVGGRLVIPGINDAHVHHPSTWKPVRVDVPAQDPTIEQTLAAVRAAAPAHPPGTWLAARFGSEAYDDPNATRTALDAAAPDHPVLLHDRAGHAALVSSAALAVLGITDATPDPPHGHYGRDASGRLTGWLHESANWHAKRKLEIAASPAAIAAAVRAFEDNALKLGITSVQTMSMVPEHRLVDALARGTRLRWRVIRWPRSGILEEFADPPARPRVRVDGVKYVLDGTPLERWAYVSRPYRDRPTQRGRANYSADEVLRFVEVAERTGEPLLVHAVGDAAIEMLLAAMERTARPERWRELRVRIEHGDLITAAQLARAARLGVVLVQNPAHFLNPQIIAKRHGDCGGSCQPLASAARAGVAIALGSDGPLNPYFNLMAATTHPTSPHEALTRETAILAYTRGAAFAEHADDKGVLAPGNLADLAVLSQDVFTVAADQLPATTAWLTIVGGDIVYAAEP